MTESPVNTGCIRYYSIPVSGTIHSGQGRFSLTGPAETPALCGFFCAFDSRTFELSVGSSPLKVAGVSR